MKNIFLGLVAGIAIGLLVAPARGAETRKKLADYFDDLMNGLTDRWADCCRSNQATVQD